MTNNGYFLFILIHSVPCSCSGLLHPRLAAVSLCIGYKVKVIHSSKGIILMLNPPYLLHSDLILSIQLLPPKILRPAKKQKINCEGIGSFYIQLEPFI